MQYLVFGAGGYIGHFLYDCMKAEGLDVIGTAHRCSYGQDMVRFDALSDSASYYKADRGERKNSYYLYRTG